MNINNYSPEGDNEIPGNEIPGNEIPGKKEGFFRRLLKLLRHPATDTALQVVLIALLTWLLVVSLSPPTSGLSAEKVISAVDKRVKSLRSIYGPNEYYFVKSSKVSVDKGTGSVILTGPDPRDIQFDKWTMGEWRNLENRMAESSPTWTDVICSAVPGDIKNVVINSYVFNKVGEVVGMKSVSTAICPGVGKDFIVSGISF